MSTLSSRLFSLSRAFNTQAMFNPILEFKGWAPDMADLANPGVTEALNVVPIPGGFGPLKAMSVESDALTARCQGAAPASDADGNTFVYAGDATKLYVLVNEGWTNVSKSGGYSTPADAQWEFSAFSPSQMVATNGQDAVQVVSPSSTSTFANLIDSTNQPTAKHIGIVGDFLILGNTFDSTDGQRSQRVWWSGLADPTDFDPSAQTQCDFQDLKEGGHVQRIIGGRKRGLIVQDNAIRLMPYVGSPLVFDLSYVIETGRGTLIPGSIVALGGMVFGIDDEGFWRYTDGAGISRIGHGQVDREFLDNFDMVYRSRVTAAIDPMSKCVVWSFPNTSASGGSPNKLFLHQYVTGEWSNATLNTEMIFTSREQGYTLDSLDNLTTDIDSLTYSLDSRAYTAGGLVLAAFDTDHKFNLFTGSNLAATIESPELQPNALGLSTIQSVRPLVHGSSPTITCAVASRATLQAAQTFGTAQSLDATGKASFTSNGRYHKFRTAIAAGSSWTHALGLQIEATPAGIQ